MSFKIFITLFTGFGPKNPVGPVIPVDPVIPVGPLNPVGPVTPVGPVDPVGPVIPVNPYVFFKDNKLVIEVPVDKYFINASDTIFNSLFDNILSHIITYANAQLDGKL